MTDSANNTNVDLESDKKDVHSQSMRINRSVDEAYTIAECDGFSLLDIAIDESRLRNMLDNDSCGAFVSFEGRVRNHNNASSVERLSYYGYEELAINQGRQIIEEAKSKFDITHAIAIHRIGALEIGDIAVWIGVVSSHRYPAFDACRWILDTIKADIPVWKQEYYENEDSKWLSNNG
ncbi:molybdenum cofactor biosynthesis protein MoaE [Psychrobacter frigidicola]|uniref:Molybdopterin synthase catalytic subunit n=1 Tax=Psychrobacter frigidicola TaxID=45611 RepID=A0A5C7ACB4_9GAMM|nr:molybdenum cofactor biosynthesis protein MoaE [Psychrobacter frigidicola]TXD98453.1 molybdenum cofactor biosynthesis protein MoaE [Psychrobacter frigidicola]